MAQNRNRLPFSKHPENYIRHGKNYIGRRKNYIRHNLNYIGPFFAALQHTEKQIGICADFSKTHFEINVTFVIFVIDKINHRHSKEKLTTKLPRWKRTDEISSFSYIYAKMNIPEYIKSISQQFRTGDAREHSYRPMLQQLLNEMLPDFVVINEPARTDCGAPISSFLRKKPTRLYFT